MKLSVKGMAITGGVVWGGWMLACGLMNLSDRSYGRQFLKVMSSVYPGFKDHGTLQDVLVGAAYGLLDGAATGALVAAVYNSTANCLEAEAEAD